MLELNYGHISGEAFQFIFGSKGLLNVFLLARKTDKTQKLQQTPQNVQTQKQRAFF